MPNLKLTIRRVFSYHYSCNWHYSCNHTGLEFLVYRYFKISYDTLWVVFLFRILENILQFVLHQNLCHFEANLFHHAKIVMQAMLQLECILKWLSMMAKPDLITCNWHHYPRPPCAPSFIKSTKLPILPTIVCTNTFLTFLKFLVCIHAGAVLSIRAGSRPKQPATGQSLAGYFRLTQLLILVRNLK